MLLVPASSPGFGYLGVRGAGTLLPGVTARSVALGGTRSIGIDGDACVLTNPAGLSRLPVTSVTVSFGPSIGAAMLSDSLGKHDSNWLSMSTLYAGLSFPVGGDLVMGAALGKVSDFAFKYTHYTYDFEPGQTSFLSEIRKFETSGGMYETAGGLSYSAADWLSLGASAGMRFGSASYDSTYEDVENPDNDTLITWKRDFSSFCWHGGIEFPLGSGLLGLSWTSEDDDYPARAAIGGMLYANDQRTGVFGAELELVDPGGRDATEVRLFGSAFLYDSFEFMGSLNFGSPNYENVETGSRLGLSLGTGIHLGDFRLDGGLSWSSLGRDSIFLVPGQPDEIKDSQAMITFGLNWRP
ncbi:MAG: hypothetical protein AVO35_00070 [Candidatus Aegiribacteria sp. MLS_C]|nr:MAG: hypothetical protein AVO35_00070 [Candidatus Aegiribacteria sp. MLS_C]